MMQGSTYRKNPMDPFWLDEKHADGVGQTVTDQNGGKLLFEPWQWKSGEHGGRHYLLNALPSWKNLKSFQSVKNENVYYYSIKIDGKGNRYRSGMTKVYRVSIGCFNGYEDTLDYAVMDLICPIEDSPYFSFDEEDATLAAYEQMLLNGILRGAFEAALQRCDSQESEVRCFKWGIRAKDAFLQDEGLIMRQQEDRKREGKSAWTKHQNPSSPSMSALAGLKELVEERRRMRDESLQPDSAEALVCQD